MCISTSSVINFYGSRETVIERKLLVKEWVPGVIESTAEFLIVFLGLASVHQWAKFPHSPIHHYTSIYGALLFSVSPVRCTCIIKYGAVRKFFPSMLLDCKVLLEQTSIISNMFLSLTNKR